MADGDQLAIMAAGVETWNAWRQFRNDFIDLSDADLFDARLPGVDLRGAKLVGADLRRADLRRANLNGADLFGSNLSGVDLRGADLHGASLVRTQLRGVRMRGVRLVGANLREVQLDGVHLDGANMSRVDLCGANLVGAHLRGVNLSRANLSKADLRGANLSHATLVETNFEQAKLSDCTIYGVAAWDVRLEGAVQSDLSINAPDEPLITVDNLEVAQFLYLMLHNGKIRRVINTLTSKVVLILGRFTPQRKAVLDALREALRQHNYVPVLFDFEGPTSLNTTETVTLLARMARFIIADLTEPSSIPQELQAIVPDVMVPMQPLLLEGARHHSMFPDFRRYPWVLPICHYASLDALLATMQEKVIARAEAKVLEVRRLRQAEPENSTSRW